MSGTVTYGQYYFNHQVPSGRIEILRGFKYQFSEVFSGLGERDVTATIYTGSKLVDDGGSLIIQRGTVAPGLENIDLGQFMDEIIPCYVVVTPENYISIVITLGTAYLSAIEASSLTDMPNCDVTFYGNSLESIGRPVNFEPGTVEG